MDHRHLTGVPPTTVPDPKRQVLGLQLTELVMLHAFLISFGVIFVAELGDKSQLMAMTFAARYRPLPILIGITISTALVHAVSVLIGVVIGALRT